jgi:DivIVA domain-containing protein
MGSQDTYRVQFSAPLAGSRGYRMDQVDAFLDVIAARLKMRNYLTAVEVHRIAFGRAPVDQGYDTQEVDGFLDRVEEILAGNRQTTRQPSRTGVSVTSPSDQRAPVGTAISGIVPRSCLYMRGYSAYRGRSALCHR